MSIEIFTFLGGGAVGAIVSTSINAFITYKTTKSNQNFQLEMEHQKHQREQIEKKLAERKRMLLEIHQLLGKVSHEFSVTNINMITHKLSNKISHNNPFLKDIETIKREAQITAKQYDATYSEICTSCDLINAYCDLFFPELSSDMNKICGEMNMFWGTFKGYLYFIETQADHKLKQSKMDELVSIANKIEKLIGTVKYRLSSIIEKME